MNSNISYLKKYCNNFEKKTNNERDDVEWILCVTSQNLNKEML